MTYGWVKRLRGRSQVVKGSRRTFGCGGVALATILAGYFQLISELDCLYACTMLSAIIALLAAVRSFQMEIVKDEVTIDVPPDLMPANPQGPTVAAPDDDDRADAVSFRRMPAIMEYHFLPRHFDSLLPGQQFRGGERGLRLRFFRAARMHFSVPYDFGYRGCGADGPLVAASLDFHAGQTVRVIDAYTADCTFDDGSGPPVRAMYADVRIWPPDSAEEIPDPPELTEYKPTAEDVAFWRAIFAAPDDEMPRLIYADWLEERGIPSAALMRFAVPFAIENWVASGRAWQGKSRGPASWSQAIQAINEFLAQGRMAEASSDAVPDPLTRTVPIPNTLSQFTVRRLRLTWASAASLPESFQDLLREVLTILESVDSAGQAAVQSAV